MIKAFLRGMSIVALFQAAAILAAVALALGLIFIHWVIK